MERLLAVGLVEGVARGRIYVLGRANAFLTAVIVGRLGPGVEGALVVSGGDGRLGGGDRLGGGGAAGGLSVGGGGGGEGLLVDGREAGSCGLGDGAATERAGL